MMEGSRARRVDPLMSLGSRTTSTAALVVLFALAGCAKHKCKLDTDAKKAALGEVAEMTQGASCEVEGAVVVDKDLVLPNLHCEIGNKNCVAQMRNLHSNLQPDGVVKQYQTWLEARGWKVEQKPYEGKRQNGKTFQGVKMHAEKGDKVLLTTVYMLADTLAEATTMAVDKTKATGN
jgi:hypothetical protein